MIAKVRVPRSRDYSPSDELPVTPTNDSAIAYRISETSRPSSRHFDANWRKFRGLRTCWKFLSVRKDMPGSGSTKSYQRGSKRST